MAFSSVPIVSKENDLAIPPSPPHSTSENELSTGSLKLQQIPCYYLQNEKTLLIYMACIFICVLPHFELDGAQCDGREGAG